MRESEVQRKIIVALQKSGWLVNKIIQCTNNGWPDLEAKKEGRTVHIEVKRPGEKPSPLQLYRMQQLRDAGFEAFPAWGINDIQHLLN